MKLSERRLRIQKHPESTFGVYIETKFEHTVFHHIVGNYPERQEAEQAINYLTQLFGALEKHPCDLNDVNNLIPTLFAFVALDGLSRLDLVYKNEDGKYCACK